MKLAVSYLVQDYKNVIFTTQPIRFSLSCAIIILPFMEDGKNGNLPEILKIEYRNILEIKSV